MMVKALPRESSPVKAQGPAMLKLCNKIFKFPFSGVECFFFFPGVVAHYDIDAQRRSGCLGKTKQV